MNTNITSGLLSFIARISKTDNIAPIKSTTTFDLLKKQPKESPSTHTDRLMRITIMMEINYLVAQLNAVSGIKSAKGTTVKDKNMLTIIILQLRIDMMKLTLRLKANKAL